MSAAFTDLPPAFACVTRVSTVLLPMYGCDSQPVSARGDDSDPPYAYSILVFRLNTKLSKQYEFFTVNYHCIETC